MPACRRKGLTLLEVMISMVLFGIILGATYAALTLAMRYSTRTRDQADLQKETLIVINKIERSLAGAAADSVQVNATEDALCFVSAESSAGMYSHDPTTGEPLFQRYVCYYARQGGLYRKEKLLVSPTRSYTPEPPDTLINDPGLAETKLTGNLEKIVFVEGSAVGIDLALKSKANPPNGMSISTRVDLKL